jgi:hypothetical protein
MHAHLVSNAGALGRRFTLCLFALLVIAFGLATPRADTSNTPKPNYALASEWTTQKVGRLVFDTSVNPRWLETSDRFWYSYQTREGRKFYLVDPIKKNKAPLFDHAKMAATLTSITREPYDSQHLPFTTVKFVKKDAAFQFDVQVARDAEIAKPKKPITTDSNGGKSGGPGPGVVEDDDGPQQGSAGAGQPEVEAPSCPGHARCISSTTWQPPTSNCWTTITSRQPNRGGRQCRRTRRRLSSGVTTTCT